MAMRGDSAMYLLEAIKRHGGLTVTSSVQKRQGSVTIVRCVAPFMLGDEQAVAVEEPLFRNQLERFLQLAGRVRVVGRIGEDPAEGATRLFDEPADRGAVLDLGDEAEGVGVGANEVAGVTIGLDEHRRVSAA